MLSCYRVRASHKHVLRAHNVYPCEHATDGGKSCCAIKARVQLSERGAQSIRGVLTIVGTLGSSSRPCSFVV